LARKKQQNRLKEKNNSEDLWKKCLNRHDCPCMGRKKGPNLEIKQIFPRREKKREKRKPPKGVKKNSTDAGGLEKKTWEKGPETRMELALKEEKTHEGPEGGESADLKTWEKGNVMPDSHNPEIGTANTNGKKETVRNR